MERMGRRRFDERAGAGLSIGENMLKNHGLPGYFEVLIFPHIFGLPLQL
jgi:hypothetical protein